jgi:hypothetical protein
MQVKKVGRSRPQKEPNILSKTDRVPNGCTYIGDAGVAVRKRRTTGTERGELFAHCTSANMVVSSDLNLRAV